jgi:hypothetical protein
MCHFLLTNDIKRDMIAMYGLFGAKSTLRRHNYEGGFADCA